MGVVHTCKTTQEICIKYYYIGTSVQFSSVTQSCPTICEPKECSTPGLPVHHQLPELAQTHYHQVGDAIQPSYPLLSPSPPAFHLSQHQGFSNESVLCIRWPEYWSFSFIQRGTKAEDMGEGLSWESPQVLLGYILNGLKSLLEKK